MLWLYVENVALEKLVTFGMTDSVLIAITKEKKIVKKKNRETENKGKRKNENAKGTEKIDVKNNDTENV